MKIAVTGSTGFLGQAVVRQLTEAGHELYPQPRQGVRDLRVESPAFTYALDCVVHLAYPGTQGIRTALEGMADLVTDQLRIDLNVISTAARFHAQKIICVGSVCEYPERVQLPTAEDQLWSGYPEPLNAPYGIAKRMQQGLLEAYRRQYGLQSTQLILGNLYGPGDRSGHVIPSLIRRACAAAKSGERLVVWGAGTASREFLYVEDAAEAIVKAVELPPFVDPINIVSGRETWISELADAVCQYCGVPPGMIDWDPSKPVGQRRRHFSYARAHTVLGWQPQTAFADGLRQTINWLREVESL